MTGRRWFIAAVVLVCVLGVLADIVQKPSYDEALRDYERMTRDAGS